ncbi:hypothetical protein PCK1_001357 [Pneumocystis canis]|nr:hypothetical protein PCK1_001357 [Pneumocystis canis]
MDPIEGIPQEILKEINELEMFVISKEGLDYIIDKLIEEMDRGLSKEGANVAMFPTWVIGYPKGSEQGTYLTLDIGGTNFRLCKVTLLGNGKFEVIQSNYNISKELKHSNADYFFGFIAKNLKEFLEKYHGIEDNLTLGFTFSYPCRQDKINHGVLKYWTKEFNVKNVEGHDVVQLLAEAFKKENIPVEVAILANDTTGTLIASNYVDSQTEIAVIFGTASYMEYVKYIPKINHMNLPPDLPIVINCEWGAFDNEQLVLPRTKYDIQLDLESKFPRQQTFEKMISGFYLGEIMRQILSDLCEKELFFKGQCFKMIKIPYSFQTPYLSLIELDSHENLMEIYDRVSEALKRIFGPDGDKIKLVPAQDGSGVGAAIIAAITTERKKRNEFVFI